MTVRAPDATLDDATVPASGCDTTSVPATVDALATVPASAAVAVTAPATDETDATVPASDAVTVSAPLAVLALAMTPASGLEPSSPAVGGAMICDLAPGNPRRCGTG